MAACFGAAHLNRNLQFVLNFTGDQGHLQAIRLDHRGDTHRLLQRELPQDRRSR